MSLSDIFREASKDSMPQTKTNSTEPSEQFYAQSAHVAPAFLREVARAQWSRETKPYAHQLDGAALLLSKKEFLLAWEMGTGKSATIAVAIRCRLPELLGPSLIICPRTVLNVWPHELQKHASLGSIVLDGTPKERSEIILAIDKSSIVVTTYEQARLSAKELEKLRFDLVVCDEIHRIKTGTNQTSRAIRNIARWSRFRYGLSGTPTPNGPIDWYGILAFFSSQVAGTTSKTIFRNRYAIYGGEVAPGIRKIVGYQNLPDLHSRVSKIAHRIKKSDCLDLPEKVFSIRTVKLLPSQNRIYREMRVNALTTLDAARGEGVLTAQNVLAASMRLLQIVGGFVPDDEGKIHSLENAKLDAIKELAEEINGPAIFFTVFVEEARAIARLFGPDAILHHGSMNPAERTNAIESWKDGAAPYFVTTTASAREGLTLVRASTCVYFSRNYNAVDWLQSQDRVHRIGQKRTVNIISLIAEQTIDEKIALALESKETFQEMLLKRGLEELL